MESATQKVETAIFAGGCFWCMEPVFDKMDGVLSVMPGYTGGEVPDPSYVEVCEGETGHAEAVLIRFDPTLVSFRELIDVFWRNIDPTTKNRQFCDFGTQYRTAVFYTSDEQRSVAEQSKRELEEKVPGGIVTEIVPAGAFYPAEEYHQQYYKKNPERYKMYHDGCGRNWRLKELWGQK
ncbi:peptide-methionine (S)-S-oxide reductase MsrA [Geomonas sp.]|uniref:peptide-methionine (S)-S-oxide reductase MsrA n=1 Tax=Geomonas sp. TaxID=2651584 RepID=UPI002B4610B8|nr:peptide-methionine (S)-S-oxide reductase MsrA [Geomonas sp.]HJV34858.1 peptide-methionine (S)-S-oxide reductase MsrA [Geomonas sp.]